MIECLLFGLFDTVRLLLSAVDQIIINPTEKKFQAILFLVAFNLIVALINIAINGQGEKDGI